MKHKIFALCLVLSLFVPAALAQAPADSTLQLILEEVRAARKEIGALSHIIGTVGVGTRTISVSPSGAPLLPETGGAINVTLPKPKKTSADAYWEAQPLEVQALRSMPVGPERTAKANELAAKGHRLEKRIHIQGWDPLSAMKAYKDAGYTWVPALGQPDIPVSPGLTFFGKPSYDPANPPAGSIKVDTSFGEGFEY